MSILDELRTAGQNRPEHLWFAYDRIRWSGLSLKEKQEALATWCGSVGIAAPEWMLTETAMTPVVEAG